MSDPIFSNQESPLVGCGTATVNVVANQAYYIPFHVEKETTFKRIAVRQGATAGNNIDVGIFELDGTKLVSSGSTARSTDAAQVIDITDTLLSPKRYYMGLSMDAVVNLWVWNRREGGNFPCLLGGMKTEASAFPLPSTATFSDPSTSEFVFPVMVLLPDA